MTSKSNASKKRPVAFFASRLSTLQAQRAEVHSLGNSLNQEIWVSEYSRQDLNHKPIDQVHLACLRAVRESKYFICVLDGTYGSRWNESDISILETEIFMAALADKPMSIFLMEPFQADSRLEGLLNIIRRVLPQAIEERPLSWTTIKDRIVRILDRENPSVSSSKLVGWILQKLAQLQTLSVPANAIYSDVRFLDGAFAPISKAIPDKDFIRSCLDQARRRISVPDRIGDLWIAFRHLSSAPYTDRKYSEFLPLWNEVLGSWSSSAAWYGLHGHLLLGRLAATNSVRDVRKRGDPLAFGISSFEHIHGTLGAVASEYYSISKRVPSLFVRHQLRKRSLYYVNKALKEIHELSTEQPDVSGYLAIRGNVYLSMWNIGRAVRDFEKVLNIRRERGHEGGLGEAEVDLGMGYLFKGKVRNAQKLLETGVMRLEQAGRTEFAVRAMRKLALYYLATFRREQASKTFRKACDLAETKDLRGQLEQLQKLDRYLVGRLTSRFT